MKPAESEPPESVRSSRFKEVVRSGSRRTAQRVNVMFTSRGLGFKWLARTQAGSAAGDTLVTLALADSLFFSVPTTEARGNVALYLLVTLAPFAILGPFLGRVFERFPTAYRGGLVMSAGLRAVVAALMVFWINSLFFLLPLAFLSLVLSRFHGIARSSVVPVVLESRSDLISGNAQLARIGVLAGAVVAPAVIGVVLLGAWFALVVAVLVFVFAARAARRLPTMEVLVAAGRPRVRLTRRDRKAMVPRPVRLARFATAAVRFLNGFLLLLVAFAFRDVEANTGEFGALLAAAGLGFFLSALATPVLDRYISEEPMVVAGLAVEAAAAFIAAQVFGLAAASLLAAAAGFAWGTAKFGFDGLLQSTVPIDHRGRAFTNAETFFQFSWVVGAIIPVVPTIPAELGLTIAGLIALVIQVIYVSAVLVPVVAHRKGLHRQAPDDDDPERPDVLDLM